MTGTPAKTSAKSATHEAQAPKPVSPEATVHEAHELRVARVGRPKLVHISNPKSYKAEYVQPSPKWKDLPPAPQPTSSTENEEQIDDDGLVSIKKDWDVARKFLDEDPQPMSFSTAPTPTLSEANYSGATLSRDVFFHTDTSNIYHRPDSPEEMEKRAKRVEKMKRWGRIFIPARDTRSGPL